METTDSAFLGGRLSLRQPKHGYRAGADPVFLAAAVQAEAGQSVLDLGCGVGTALFCLAARVDGLDLTGVELQAELAALAQENAERNGFAARIVQGDVTDLPKALRERRFDHVITNPPFFDRACGSAAPGSSREAGRGEGVNLAAWLDIALRRTAPKGRLTLINRIERLPECLAAMQDRAGDIVVLPLLPRRDRAAKLFLMTARKDAKGPFALKAPLILHDGDSHQEDRDSYSARVQDILRRGQALSLRN
jgi:tRNA1(Val) A37 N6-methylase TrmN6